VLRANPSLRPEYLEGGELGFDYTGFPGLQVGLTAAVPGQLAGETSSVPTERSRE
jgi:hypothetical protein